MAREIEMLNNKVALLDKERKYLATQLEAEKQKTGKAEEEVHLARKDAQKARKDERKAREETNKAMKEAQEAEIDGKGKELTILSLRYEKINSSAHRNQIKDSLPSWIRWNVHIPYGRLPYDRMVEFEGRLVVAGWDGNLHIFNDKENTWNTLVRKNGNIRNVVCHEDVCLLLVYDVDKHQRVIEQFYLNDDDKWHSLAVLPNELQLDGVSVALRDNSLYVVGGETQSGSKVSTARVFDFYSGLWSKMDDLHTKRSSCSSVIINNTMFVGGGETDGLHYSSTVECADVRTRGWSTVTSTSNYRSTLTKVSNRLVGTGGTPRQCVSPSNVVELYDERSSSWLPLPPMKQKRWSHAAFSSHNGKLVTAGGIGEHTNWLTSIESLNC